MSEIIDVKKVPETQVENAFNEMVSNGYMHAWKINDLAKADRFNMNNMALVMMIMSSHFVLDGGLQKNSEALSETLDKLTALSNELLDRASKTEVAEELNTLSTEILNIKSMIDDINELASSNVSGIAKIISEMATDDEVLAALNNAIGNHYTKDQIGELLKSYSLSSVMTTELGKKADAQTMTTELGKKADAQTMTTELGKKADLGADGKIPSSQLPSNVANISQLEALIYAAL